MPTCMIGMSGGVDSSVAACLLKEQGYDCIGVTMKLHTGADGVCGALNDADDAKNVCLRLRIPHYIFDFTSEFDRNVVAPFAMEYENGRTPNPCIACNRHLKFGALWQKAQELGCDYIATGHYARIVSDSAGALRLRKAADLEKDQSYVLYFLSQEQLSHTLFPLGELTKAQVRQIAKKHGFINAKKQESQDICFIPDGDYGTFLEQYTGKKYDPGDFIDPNGHVLGQHKGAVRYTLGQRKGLGVSAESRLYVLGKDMANNTVTLGSNDALFTRELTALNVNLAESIPPEGRALKAKIRYRQTEQPCRAFLTGNRLCVKFDAPQRAVTSGQAVVLYDGDTVFGGGTIE